MKRFVPFYLRSLLLSALFVVAGLSAFASHIVGMDLNYQWVSGNTYRITVVAYGDCGTASAGAYSTLATATPNVCVYNGATLFSTVVCNPDAANSNLLSAQVCTADTGLTTCTIPSSTIIGIKKFTYTGTVTLSGPSHTWRFIFNGNMGAATGAGRAASITNINTPGTTITTLIDSLDNTYHNNSSVKLAVEPTPYYCLNNLNNYNPGATDPDGDSLRFVLSNGLTSAGGGGGTACNPTPTNVTYTGGTSAASPLLIAAGSLSFNQITGQLNFIPNASQRALVVYSIREFRNDTFIGTSMREMTFLVQTCTNTPPWGGLVSSTGSGYIADSLNYQICLNSGAFTLTTKPTESNTTGNITVTSFGLPAGSSVSVVGNGTPNPTATFSWTSTGVAAGTYTFFLIYRDDACPINGLSTYAFNVTINSLGAITGTASTCVGGTTALTDATAGGVWSSNNTGVATVGSSDGIVFGTSAGTATISYSVGTCFVTKIVTVTAVVAPINPSSVSVCIGTSQTLTDATAGGTWSSSDVAIATVSSIGTVTGAGVGTATITYAVAGCASFLTVTVNNAATPISPATTTVCTGNTVSLTDATTGGTWAASNANATVSASGVVTGVTAGTVTITYTVGACTATALVTVQAGVAAISPSPLSICLGGTSTLSDSPAGGTWSSSNTAVATVTGAGVVTSVGIGAAIITYTLGGCFDTVIVNVNTAPVAITPASSIICVGNTVNLTDATAGGAWSTGNAAVATVSGTGVVTGTGTGIVSISYTIGTCVASATVSVTAAVGAINPAPVTICLGGSVTLTDATAGGTWSSSNGAVATISAGGVLTSTGIGTTTISYNTGGCAAVTIATVNSAPGAITPATATVCTGSTVNLTDATTGGVWTASNGNATVSGTGVVTGVAAGTVTISYAIGTCSSTALVTVNTSPGAINPTPVTVCLGGTTTLTNGTAGGAWSSSNTGVATISAGGLVTAVSTGTTIISYILSGCSATTIATVNSAPSPIVPSSATVCTGTTTNLTDAVTGGVWSASNGNATVSGTGVVTGISVGTVTISYAIGTCNTTATVTVNAGVSPISPATLSLCIGNTATVSDATGGGAWSSSNGNATISAGGLVTAVTAGTSIISYTVGLCSATIIATVAPSPSAISPATGTVCVGATLSLSDAVGGGVWSASNSNVIVASGIVSGVTPGTSTITYSIGSCIATATVTINPASTAGTITGPASICPGSSVTLTPSVSGGVWSASNANATVSATGVVTGVSLGTDVISYAVTTVCGTSIATLTVTVSATANSGNILGPATICVGSFNIYIDSAIGGVWSLTNGNAVISPVGVVTALVAGSETVVYTVPGSCTSSFLNITIVPAISAAGPISGPTSVCIGSTVTLSDPTTPGGVWSMTNGRATINASSGLVTAVSPGLDTVIYTLTTACGTYSTTSTMMVDASATPAPIAGPSTVCIGGTITLSDADLGGAWSSSNARATVVPGTGVVTGISSGLDTIKYTVINGCGLGAITKVITVTAAPSPGTITGASSVCVGATIALTDAVAGGTWSTSNSAANVDATGHVIGISGGTVTVYYTITASCGAISATKVITVNSLSVGPILGPDSLCVGTSITELEFTPGGVWSAGNTHATVVGGIVTGVSSGTVPISYTVSTSCGTGSAVKIVHVMAPGDPGVIVGINDVCVGSAITLTDSVPGGIWLTSNGTAVLLGPGIVSGVSVGIDSIFYLVTNMCGTDEARHIVNVNPSPVVPAISGTPNQCVGTSITFTDVVSGGIWTSTDPAIATVNATTGKVTGVSAGLVDISYTITNSFGCPGSATITDTVSDPITVMAINGNADICVGSVITFNDSTAGGVWSSSNATVATVDASGLVTAIGSGAATISYTVTGACNTATATFNVTVHSLPIVGPISGATVVCIGLTTTLSDATTGGVWTSTDTTIAIVDPSIGVVTGNTSGAVNIIYTVTNSFGCVSSAIYPFTVNPYPVISAITGTASECVAGTTTLFDATGGGGWSSSDVTIATVDGSGNVTGVSGGTATITYTVTSGAGCSATATIVNTVNTVPAATAITGTLSVCEGSSTTLTNSAAGGVWSSNDATIATVDAAGVVTGVAAGTDFIFYTVSNGCGSVIDSATITVNATPVVNPIIGAVTTSCVGATITLTDATTGGVWSTSDSAVATVDASGVITGIASGTATITYGVSSGSCTGIAIYNVTIAPGIGGIGVVPASATLCHGALVNMHTTTIVPGITYQWMIDGNVIDGATNSSYTADSAGTYSLMIGNGSCTYTISGTVVSNQPDAVVGFNAPNVLFTGSFYYYQWFLNGVAIPGANSSTYYESNSGDYTVVVTDINGCSDTASSYNVGSGTGVKSITTVGNVRVYPNPAISMLSIEAAEIVNASILSVDGKTLISQKNAKSIDISALANGMYMIMIYDENDRLLLTSKFVKADQ